MPTYRLSANGVPFQIESDASAEDVQAAFMERIQASPELVKQRQKQLGLSDEDVEQMQETGLEHPVEVPEGGMARFLVGAGRSFTKLGRGVDQLFQRAIVAAPQGTPEQERSRAAARTTAEGRLKELQRLESQERKIFSALDNQGIGMEDLGQITPDLLSFLGSGGLVSLATRGALLGGVEATGEGEDLEVRGKNAMVSGLLTAAGPAAAGAGASVIKKGASFTRGGFDAVKAAASSNRGNPVRGLAGVLRDSGKAAESDNPAIRELGKLGFERASAIVQQLNSRGKEGLVAEAANKALEKSIRTTQGGNVVDFGKFSAELARFGGPQMKKELGSTFGNRLNDLRNTFDEVAGVIDLQPAAAERLLSSFMADPTTRTMAKTFRETTEPKAKQAVLQALMTRVNERNIADATARAALTAATRDSLEEVGEQVDFDSQ